MKFPYTIHYFIITLSTITMILLMPSELHNLILSFLPIRDVICCVSTCKQLHGILSGDTFWKHRLLLDYNNDSFLLNLHESYKLNYRLTNLSYKLPYQPSISELFHKTDLNISNYNNISPYFNFSLLSNLKKICLYKLNFSSFPLSICDLHNLESLNLGNNLIISLPPQLGGMLNLTHLYVENNLLTCLPSEIGNLVNLKCLYVSGNCLISLPPELFKLTNLVDIWLKNNHICTLSPDIGKFT